MSASSSEDGDIDDEHNAAELVDACLTALGAAEAATDRTWTEACRTLALHWNLGDVSDEDIADACDLKLLALRAARIGPTFLAALVLPAFGLDWALTVLSQLPDELGEGEGDCVQSAAFWCGRHARWEPEWAQDFSGRSLTKCRQCGVDMCAAVGDTGHSMYCSDSCYYRAEY